MDNEGNYWGFLDKICMKETDKNIVKLYLPFLWAEIQILFLA